MTGCLLGYVRIYVRARDLIKIGNAELTRRCVPFSVKQRVSELAH